MGIERFYVHPITIVHPGSELDSHNNLVDDWDNATSITAYGWPDRNLDRTNADEVLTNRDARIVEWKLFLPAGTDITAKSRVIFGGKTYEVDGEPYDALTPSGVHHMEVALKGVAG